MLIVSHLGYCVHPLSRGVCATELPKQKMESVDMCLRYPQFVLKPEHAVVYPNNTQAPRNSHEGLTLASLFLSAPKLYPMHMKEWEFPYWNGLGVEFLIEEKNGRSEVGGVCGSCELFK